MKKIPVIIDTDIGGDIDDTWALCFALLREELDIRLVTTVLGDPVYSAKIIAKMCEACGRNNTEIGLCKSGISGYFQNEWVKDYDLSSYEGKIHEDGVGRMIQIIMESEEPVTILGMGPCTNLAEALKREPGVGEKARVISVFGAVNKGYFGDVCSEYNVNADLDAAIEFFNGYKNIEISPIDTCFDITLGGERYKRLLKCRSENKAVNAVLENFEAWGACHPRWKNETFDHTSELCDTVPVYLAISHEGIRNEQMKLTIDKDGFTRVSPDGRNVNVAIEWHNKDYFLDFLTDTYCR